MRTPTTRRFVAAFLCLAFATTVLGHDLYILPKAFRVAPGALLTVAFHNGDAFPESEVAPRIERLKSAQLAGASGSVPVHDLTVSGTETLGTAKAARKGSYLLAVQTVPNLIELPAAKFLDYLKEEGLDDIIEWRRSHRETEKPGRERYTKFAKSLIQSGNSDSFYKHSFKFPIEIIPLADPYAIAGSGSLPIRVMFQGKPAAGLALEAAWALGTEHKTTIVGRTGPDGAITVPLPRAGMWRLHALKMERCADPRVADWESYWASLTFEIR